MIHLIQMSHLRTTTAAYLSIPFDVERAFSGGRRLLSFTRNRLSAESIRRRMCLGSWGKSNLV
ncbi:hypothetical protein DFH08DRAFT_756375, partial [Mycena albidolilacea]